MDLYEYQGKQFFAQYGIPVSPGGVADIAGRALGQKLNEGGKPDAIETVRGVGYRMAGNA